ncbi:MAG: DUF1080 domain-containing protein, partial [Sedimentisphaerales bacterium]|nr:DUF1080 domain-containing protein [Sedimentisphaerales bacterium]
MFRVQDENNYYRFSWNNLAGYSRLIKVVNGTASQLASRPEGFVLNRDYQIKVVSSGSELRVYVDNVLWLSATDATFDSGTIGLYCWGNAPGTFFDNVLVTEVQNEEPVQQTTPDLTDEFADGDLADWIVVDQGDQLGPSDWSVSNGVLSQTTHIYSAPTSPSTLHKPGTFVKYANGRGWADYQVACTLRSAGINDCGVMFRVQDDNNYYRFSWNQQVGYSRLIRVINGTATLLASHTKGFYVNQNYEIRIVAAGSQISVYVNDVLWLSASDSTFDMGSIGLYCWGNAPGTFFDNIVVQEIQ